MRRLALLACGLGACGDNLLAGGDALAPAADLIVVAHQDDDLLFMQPDLLEAIRRGEGVTSVYVTAGNGTHGADHAEPRYAGLMAAYGAAAGAHDWRCGWLDIAGRIAEHCRLDTMQVSLIFLAYPDGGKEGELANSLLHLWEGTIAGADTIADRTAYYDRAGLVDTVADIVRETQPRTLHTLDVAATHGRDHSDHMIVGALALLALASANSHADAISYRGYDIADEPPNKNEAVFGAALGMLAYYEACATDCAACGEPCTTVGDAHVTWLLRRYAVGFRRAAAGSLRSGTQCLTSTLELAPCETAPAWRIDAGGELRELTTGSCLDVSDTGELAMSPCLGGRSHRFFVDDEGHVWSGIPPLPEPNMDYAHLWCLAPTATGVRIQLCGADRAPSWDFVPHATETQRADLLLTATGREVRLGDITGDGKADLCAFEGALVCAAGDGAGGFAPAVRLDDASAPLVIDPRSLTLGDVDGDGKLDACGRNSTGVACALAATAFAAAPWLESFNDGVARPGTSASLTALDADADSVADICGVETSGVVCAAQGAQPIVRSQWPSPSAVVWPADLDGDRQADWCVATDTGPACAAFAQRELTTDGVAWGYAQGGMVEVAPATTATVALGDIDGDGRADLCSLHEDRILCARSQGRGFGPRMTFAILPNQAVASALWLGDLDGDGRADACADTGATITCAVEP